MDTKAIARSALCLPNEPTTATNVGKMLKLEFSSVNDYNN